MNRPIAIFDSGIGGLSVLKEVAMLLPNESYIYFGDGKNCPYGDKSCEEIAFYTKEAIEKIISLGAKLIVIACNTATSVVIKELRANYPIPFVAIEPAVKPAVLSTKSGVVAVLATKRTIEGESFLSLCKKWSDKATILKEVGVGFVSLVENNLESSPEGIKIVEKQLLPLLEQGADKIILGCTHFPFLKEQMKQIIGDRDVEIIDPAPFIAARVKQVLTEKNLLDQRTETLEVNLNNNPKNLQNITFLTAADSSYIESMKQQYLKILE